MDAEAAGDGSGPVENHCLTRVRHRRLLAFLRGQRYDGAFNALLRQAREHFSLEHIQQLVKEGLWEDAIEYLNSFLPACPRSFGAQIFHNFLLMHRQIARLVAGHTDAIGMIEQDKKCMNWEGVRKYAADDLERLVWQTPELNGRLTLPDRHMMPRDVVPVGLGFPSRRRMKKQAPLAKPATVARVIRGSQRYIRRLKRSSFESFDEAKEWLSTMIDGSLRGGLHAGCYLLKPTGNEGDPTLPLWEVTSCAENSGVAATVIAGDSLFHSGS